MNTLKSKIRYHAANEGAKQSKRPWHAGVWTRAPVSGLLALTVALLCGLATIVVLKAADGVPIDHWQVRGYAVQPTVILSVLATLANALFRYAFTEGARVSWWVTAQRGTSIGALHRAWDHSQSAVPILTGRRFSLLAISSLSTLIVLIDGPLLQRASTISQSTRRFPVNLTVPMSPTPFIVGATGYLVDRERNPSLYTELFSTVLQQYNGRQPITLPEFGCKGKCELMVEAPGFDIDCSSWNSPYRLMSTSELVQWIGNDSYHGPAQVQSMFAMNVTFSLEANRLWAELRSYRTGVHVPQNDDWSEFPWNTIMLSSMIKSNPGGNGSLTWRTCILREALQEYPISVENSTVTLQSFSTSHNYTVYQVIRSSTETSSMGWWPTTLGGIWLSVYHQFAGEAKLSKVPLNIDIETKDSSPLAYLNLKTSMSTYAVTWLDPIDDAISMIRELSLRMAIATTSKDSYGSSGTEWLTAVQSDVAYPDLRRVNRTLSQHAQALATYSETVYQSNLAWLGGALAVLIVTAGAIIPLFQGWWQLGRPYSMSPIEIARAFDAPLLRESDDNCSAGDLIKYTGKERVMYGAVSQPPTNSPVIWQEFHSLRSDQDEEEISEESQARSLHFGRQGMMEKPFEGEVFGRSLGNEHNELVQLRRRRP